MEKELKEPNGRLSYFNSIQEPKNGLTAVDLFCGAGVGAYGIKKAGYEILFGVDNDKFAVETYNLNIGNHAICQDIRNLKSSDIPKHDLMIATPVCKPFSVCGVRRLTDDEKYGDLLAETIRLFSECKPRALFFENVAGLVLGNSLPIFNEFVEQIQEYGYCVYWSVFNCWDYGVPQERVRVFLVAIRTDCKHDFLWPEPVDVKTTMRDAIYDLKGKTIDDVKNHNADYVKHFDNDFVVKHRQRDWDEPAMTVLSDYVSPQYYPEPKVTDWKDFEHLPRRLSVREHLRLQTVGDDFYFPSDVSKVEQYTRCSGIPSLMSYKIGMAIKDCLLGNTPIRQYDRVQQKLF